MATGKSGYFDIAGSHGFTFRFHWSEEYDITANTSQLWITNIQAKSTQYVGLWFPDGTISIDGKTVKTMENYGYATHGVRVYANETWGDLYSPNPGVHGNIDFPWDAGIFVHNSDGTKEVEFTSNLKLWRDHNTGASPKINGSVILSLTTIPRLSDLSASGGTLGVEQTLTVTKQADDFTHTIKYASGTASGTICDQSSDTSILWEPPISLATQNTTGVSVPVTLSIETFSGSASIGSKSILVNYSIPASVAPFVTIATEDPTGNFNTFGGYVQNQSTCKITLTASGSQGSTIKSYSIEMGKSSAAGRAATFKLPTAGNVTIKAKVTDSRGRTAETTATITVLQYENPSVSASAYRSDADGNADPVGGYMSVKFSASITALSDLNSHSYSVQYRLKGATSWTRITPTASGYTPTDNVTVIEVNAENSYEAKVVASDDFSSASSTINTVLSAYAMMHIDKVNNRIGLGKIAEGTNILDVGLNARFRGNVSLDEPLSFENGGTGGKTIPEIWKNLGISVKVVTEAGTDLNDYTKPGWYYFESSYTPKNIPAGSNGWLQVIDTPDHVNSWTKQLWYRSGTPGTNDQQTFVRTKLNNNAWGAWAQYYTTRDFTMDFSVFRTLAEIGLSGSVTTKQVFDAMPAQSIFIFTNNTGSTDKISDAPTGYCLIELTKDATYGRGQASSINSSTPTHYISTYYPSGQTFTGWDCLDVVAPIGAECKTSEFWNGKRVYTKLVNCGKMTNGGTYTYSSETVYPVRFAGYCNGHALPVLLSDAYSGTWKMWVYVKNSVITAFFGSSWSSPNVFVQVWYVKE